MELILYIIKRFLKEILIIVFLSSLVLHSQTMDWRMVQQIGDNTGSEEVRDMVMDSEGNVYTVGSFYGTITWGSQTLTAQGHMDGFLAKMDCMGKLIWTQQLSGSGWDNIQSVSVDKDDNIIIAGRFGLAQASIAGYTMSSLGGYDLFVAKCDAQGNFLWVKEYGSSANDGPGGITTDEEGDIYLTGSYSNLFGFGGQSWTTNGQSDFFIFKLSSTGKDLWFYSAGGTANEYGSGIEVKDDFVYVCGDFQNTVDFGTGPLSSNGDYDIFVFSIDTLGISINWVNTVGSTTLDCGYDLEINSQGELLMCGEMGGTLSFGNGINLSPQPSWYNSYIVKMDQNGSAIWGYELSCNEEVYAYECEIDDYDNVYVTGTMFGQTTVNNLTMDISGGTTFWYDNTFLFMLDNSGMGQWELSVPGDGMNNHGNALAVNSSNDIFLGGRVDGINTFGSLPPISGDLNNSTSAFVALYGRPELQLSCNGELDSIYGCDQVVLKANEGALNYIWYADGVEVQQGLSDSFINTSITTHIVEDKACPIDRDTFVLDGAMSVQMSPSDTPIVFCPGDEVQIQLSGADIYSWGPTNYLSCSDCAAPFITPMSNIIYEVTMEKALCRDTLSISFEEKQDCAPGSIYVPTAFSPNADGKNDVFKVRYTGLIQGQLEIYNRWGELMYQNSLDESWDGYYKSKKASLGVYIYHLTYTDIQGKSEAISGNLTLIR